MLLSFAISLVTIVFLGVLLRAIARRRAEFILSHQHSEDPSVASDRESFTAYYRPMLLLLDREQLCRAQSLEGISAEDFSRFRRQRVYAFRSYLNEMKLDFHRIEFKLRYLMLSATQQEADLVMRLNRLKASFQWNLWKVQIQLFLFQWGAGTVNPTPLVQALEEFELSLTRNQAQIAQVPVAG
jgi:hypothetical protein